MYIPHTNKEEGTRTRSPSHILFLCCPLQSPSNVGSTSNIRYIGIRLAARDLGPNGYEKHSSVIVTINTENSPVRIHQVISVYTR